MSNELVPTQVEADQTTISSILAMMQEFQDHVKAITGCNVGIEVAVFSNRAEHAHWFDAAEQMEGAKITEKENSTWVTLGPEWKNQLYLYKYVSKDEAGQ